MNATATPLTREQKQALGAEARYWIAEAARVEITLTRSDFQVIDGELYVDSMDPKDWLDAMIMD